MADQDLEFLDSKHEVYEQNEDAWKREERRLFGGDAAIEELARWAEEKENHYELRLREASYLNFPKLHASTLAGHLGRVAPVPDLGTLGSEIRSRKEARAQPRLAELIYYNVDGIGSDASQWPAFMNGVQERAIATGHRWVLVEMPSADVGRSITQADVLAGHRPYLVEYSPLAVTNWETSHGRLDWAVVRVRTRPAGQVKWEPLPKEAGYYLLVRQGYEGFGPAFSGGGWWLFDKDKQVVDEGDWSKTRGEVPLVPLVAESSQGTTDWPAISRSLTMELGQISVSLMNRISERNYDAADAAKSIKYLLGADKDSFNLTVEFHEQNALIVPVIGAMTPDGKYTVPTIYDGSSGAIPAEVFTTIINSTIAEAHEIMVRQITAGEEASGTSRDKAFGEGTSPMLAGLASRRESFENTIIHFLELRAGAVTPTGFVTWPTEFELAPLLSKIDRTIERMKSVAVRSPTLEADLVEKAAQDDGLWPTDEAKAEQASAELLASAQATANKAKADTMLGLVNAGVDMRSAATTAGFSDEEAARFVEGEAEAGTSIDDRRKPPPEPPA